MARPVWLSGASGQSQSPLEVVRRVGHEPDVGQVARLRKALRQLCIKHKVRCKHITRCQPECLAQQRQCAGNAASGFQRMAKVVLLMRILQLHALCGPDVIQMRGNLRAQPGGIHHHITRAITQQGGHVPVQQRTALHLQQGFGVVSVSGRMRSPRPAASNMAGRFKEVMAENFLTRSRTRCKPHFRPCGAM